MGGKNGKDGRGCEDVQAAACAAAIG